MFVPFAVFVLSVSIGDAVDDLKRCPLTAAS
jgi:hypothetical protein